MLPYGSSKSRVRHNRGAHLWRFVRALAIALGCPMVLISQACWCPRPSDASIIERFDSNRADWEAVAAAVRANPDVLSDPKFAERLQELGVMGLWPSEERPPRELEFRIERFGIVNNGWTKGVLNSLDAPSPLRSSLDCPAGIPGVEHSVVYREIAPGWYIYVAR